MQSCAIMNKRLHKIRVRTEASAEMENGMEQKSGMQMIPLDTINGFPVRPGFYLENGAMALSFPMQEYVYDRIQDNHRLLMPEYFSRQACVRVQEQDVCR